MKLSNWRWPLVTVILSSFALGALWGWKIIRDQAEEEGRLESVSAINILAPHGVFPQKLLLEFQKQERIRVILHEDPFPASLLRKALKSSPGQYDAALLFHYQVSALRNERRLQSLFDSRVKFPTSISPDFRKLPDDRNLMDTAPLQWGLLGKAQAKQQGKEAGDNKAPLRFSMWPPLLIGGEASDLPVQNFVTKYLSSITPMNNGESLFSNIKAPNPLDTFLVSHAALSFPPFKDLHFEFSGLPLVSHQTDRGYFLWILTLTAIADGDLEGVRKLMRFLLDPARNLALVQATKIGATTLRDQEALNDIPEALRSSYIRKFPLQAVIVERDERVRQAEDLVEQAVLGAAIVPKTVLPRATPAPVKPTAEPVASPARKATPKPTPIPVPTATPVATPDIEPGPDEPATTEPKTESIEAPPIMEPSEEQSPGD